MCTSGVAGPAGLDAALDGLAGEDLAGLPDLALVQQAAQLQDRLHRLQAQLTRRVAAVHGRGAAVADGMASTQAVLRVRLRLNARAAAEQVRVARALAELPDTAAAFEAGEISFEHASALVAAARRLGKQAMAAGGEKLLLEQARDRSPGWVHRLARYLHERLDPDGHEDSQRRQFQDRWLQVARTFEGMVAVQGMLDAISGELLLSALAAFTPAPAPSIEESRTPGQTRVDALADMCRAALGQPAVPPAERPASPAQPAAPTAQPPAPHSRPDAPAPAQPQTSQARPDAPAPAQPPAPARPQTAPARPQVTVTIPLDTLRQALGHDAASLGPTGVPICAATARRLCCDAALIPAVLGTAGEPLDIGRQTRIIPTGLRRALVLRDKGCRFPGCDTGPDRTDGHHLRHWSHGGPTSLANLVLLCGFHHWLVHDGH